MEIICSCCEGNITAHTKGRSELHCPYCAAFINCFGQRLKPIEEWDDDYY